MNHDPKILCTAFKPPIPMSADGYLDEVTKGMVKDVSNLGVFDIDEAIDLIEARPSLPEQAYLLAALEERLLKFGWSHGYTVPPPDKALDVRTEQILKFIVEDTMGVKMGGTAQDKSMDEFKGKLKEVIKDGLNNKGKAAFELLNIIHDLSEAKSPEEVVRIFGNTSTAGLGAYLKHKNINAEWLMRKGMKLGGVRPVVRNRIIKLISIRLSWKAVWAARAARVAKTVNPFLLFIDIFLTPESIGSSEDEARLTFLLVYSRLFKRKGEILGKLVISCTKGTEWRYARPPAEALKDVINQMSSSPSGQYPSISAAPNGSTGSASSTNTLPISRSP